MKETRESMHILLFIVVLLALISGVSARFIHALDIEKELRYITQANEVVVVRGFYGPARVYRAGETAVYDSNTELLTVMSTRGTVYLGRNKPTEYSDTHCAQSISFHFIDDVRATVCGEVSYQLPSDNETLILITKGGGERWVRAQVLNAVYFAAVGCSVALSAIEVTSDVKRAEFFDCVSTRTKSGNPNLEILSISVPSTTIDGLEFQDDVQARTDK
jgi:hypothetical protein